MHRFNPGTKVEYDGQEATVKKQYPSSFDNPAPMYTIELESGEEQLIRENEVKPLMAA